MIRMRKMVVMIMGIIIGRNIIIIIKKEYLDGKCLQFFSLVLPSHQMNLPNYGRKRNYELLVLLLPPRSYPDVYTNEVQDHYY
jgi:hypothetical protein